VSLAADYNSNPFLVTDHASAAESAAVQGTIPLTYSNEAQSFDLWPRVRLAKSRGDAELLTDYEYLDGDWHLNSERSSLVLAASWHRDSTFYNLYENAELRGHSLPRLEEEASISWQRSVSERSSLQASSSYDQSQYSAQSGLRLENYNYLQGALQYQLALSERWGWSSGLGIGRYELRNQDSSNENRFVQTSLTRTLSERWSASMQLGYSRVSSSAQSFLCCEIVSLPTGGFALEYVPVRESSTGGVVSYALSLDRKTELLELGFSASRSVQPSALGGLVTQNDVKLDANLAWNERLGLLASISASQQTNSLAQQAGPSTNRSNYVVSAGANWQWTEHWALGLLFGYDLARIDPQNPLGRGTSASVTLTRQLGRVVL